MLKLLAVLAFSGLTTAVVAGPADPVRFTNAATASRSRNLVPNAAFEAGAAGWSSYGEGAGSGNQWAPVLGRWGNFFALHGQIERTGGADGKAFLRIPLGGRNTPVFNFDYFYPVDRRELRPLAANEGWIAVTPGVPYTLSVSLRGSQPGLRAALGVQTADPAREAMAADDELLKRVVLTTEWKRYTYTFTPQHPFLFVLAGPDLEHDAEVTVDVDDIQLEQGAAATPFVPHDEVEIGITPTATGGVFVAGEPAQLAVTATNHGGAAVTTTIGFQVTDFADQPVEFPELTLAVAPQATVTRSVALPAGWAGFYRVVARSSRGGIVGATTLRLAIVPPRTDDETVIGINHAYATDLLLNLAQKAGVSWYRDWSLKWQHVEPAPGEYHWAVADAQINRLAQRQLKTLAIVPFPSAEWNSTAPSLEELKAVSPRYRAGGTGDDQELMLRARWAWLPKNVSELTQFVGAAAARYRAQVPVWEVLNEPLYTTYSLPDNRILKTDKLKPYAFSDYIAVLKAVAPAIRAANPAARIMAGPGNVAPASTLPLIDAGLLDYIDLFGVHEYPNHRAPETLLPSMDKLQAAMQARGAVKPIWMTEFSYFGTDDLPRQPFVPLKGLWSEDKLLTEKQVADYTVRYATIFLARGGERLFLHSGSTGWVNNGGTESCLFADGAVRKIYPALAVFTTLLGAHPRPAGDIAVGTALGFAFETGTQSLVVLWDPAAKARVTLPPGTTCRNLMGRSVAGPSVSLGQSPVYVAAAPGTAKATLARLTVRSDGSPAQ